jgi:hypothetical protein
VRYFSRVGFLTGHLNTTSNHNASACHLYCLGVEVIYTSCFGACERVVTTTTANLGIIFGGLYYPNERAYRDGLYGKGCVRWPLIATVNPMYYMCSKTIMAPDDNIRPSRRFRAYKMDISELISIT